MNDIFNSWLAMDCFCYDIIEAWVKDRKNKNKPYDEDSYLDWLEEFRNSMEMAFGDLMEDEEEDET